MEERNGFCGVRRHICALAALAIVFLTYGYAMWFFTQRSSIYQTARRHTVSVYNSGESGGTGWVYQEGGRYFIVTANHVVPDGVDSYVFFDDRRGYHKVKKHGWDAMFDVALLTLEDPAVIPLGRAVLGNSDLLVSDETVFTVGNPLGVRFVGLRGRIVNYRGSVPEFLFYYRPVLLDLTCNPGQSGGAILNTRAEVVGTVASIDSMAGNDGRPLCYGISINVVKKLLPKLMAGGEIKHGRIGILFANVWELTPSQKQKYQLENVAGNDAVVVGVVHEGFPAQLAGIQKGDVLLAVSSSPAGPWVPIRETAEFKEYWNSTFFAGDTAFLKLGRGNTHFLKKVTLVPLDAAPQ